MQKKKQDEKNHFKERRGIITKYTQNKKEKNKKLCLIGGVCYFNDISTLMGYLMWNINLGGKRQNN